MLVPVNYYTNKIRTEHSGCDGYNVLVHLYTVPITVLYLYAAGSTIHVLVPGKRETRERRETRETRDETRREEKKNIIIQLNNNK